MQGYGCPGGSVALLGLCAIRIDNHLLPLSRREIAILHMIADGMSDKGIARSLGIAPETVKSHAKSIFIKLATRTRAQAVARAEAIGFLWS
jgi:LuxR family maltose regulon positive regulatory protein